MSRNLWHMIEKKRMPAFWNDGKVVHQCEGSQVHPGIFLVWTKCARDVPADKAFVVTGIAPEITCRGCVEQLSKSQGSGEP